MSADVLRRASALMRERAEACEVDPDEENWYTLPADGVLSTRRRFAESAPDDAEHIASWHPAVALAVADWLDVIANRADEIAETFPAMSARAETVVRGTVDGYNEACAAARRYLGEEAS